MRLSNMDLPVYKLLDVSALMLMCIPNCGNELFFDKNQQAPKSDSILVLFNIDSENQIIRQRTGECASGCK